VLEVLILGPLDILHDGKPVVVRGPKQRALLALLTLHAGEAVLSDHLRRLIP
jgi:DNA-binding SARP family transcriptional activator